MGKSRCIFFTFCCVSTPAVSNGHVETMFVDIRMNRSPGSNFWHQIPVMCCTVIKEQEEYMDIPMGMQKRNTAVATAVAPTAHQFIGAMEPGPMFSLRLWFRFSLVTETILKQTTDTSHTVRQNQHAGTTAWPFSFLPYPCGVSCLRVVLQDAGHAEVRHFADQVAVDQNVASSEVPVHVAHVRQVLHPWANATQHPHQLDDCESAIVLLHMGKGAKSQSLKLKATLLPLLKLAKSRAEDSHLLSNKMQCYFLALLTSVYNSPVKQKPRGSVTAFSDAVSCLQWIWF